MSLEPRDDDRGKRPAGAELILPVAGTIFTLYYFSTILHSPWEAQVGAFFVGFILIGLVVLFAIKTVVDVRGGTADLGFGGLFRPDTINLKRLGLFLLTLGYVVVIDWLGFTITSFLYLTSAMLLLAERKRVGLIVPLAAGISLVGYLLFVVAFETRFPDGPFERLVEGIV